jgi:hypothetical protein
MRLGLEPVKVFGEKGLKLVIYSIWGVVGQKVDELLLWGRFMLLSRFDNTEREGIRPFDMHGVACI